MCGIFGYIGYQQASNLLLNGLRRLEYRGYDSTGIAVLNGNISASKCIGRVADLESIITEEIKGSCGIAHTRWATHGGVTDENAHPHLSEDGTVAIIHNGIIENYRQLRTWLTAEGVILRSETDSEVLACSSRSPGETRWTFTNRFCQNCAQTYSWNMGSVRHIRR